MLSCLPRLFLVYSPFRSGGDDGPKMYTVSVCGWLVGWLVGWLDIENSPVICRETSGSGVYTYYVSGQTPEKVLHTSSK